MPEDEEAKKITEALYQQNLEISIKNRTLSLLEKLYQMGILILTPEILAKNIADIIRQELNMEFAGIIVFDKDSDSLLPLAFSRSERLIENVSNSSNFRLEDLKIIAVKNNPIFKKIVYDKENFNTNDVGDIIGTLITPESLAQVKEKSHVKTFLIYPLISGEEVLGILIFGLNRDYDTLNVFEKESISSLIDIVALSLDKVSLYKELQDANVSLQNLLKQRESLTHLITHKVKGSFTRTKILFASMLDGTFGEISPEIRKRAQQGLDFDNGGLETVDLVLNVANMQNGIIKYEMKSVNFKELVELTISEKKIPAEARGLKLEEIEIKNDDYTVLGDAIWLKEAVNNLIENSIKYTREGKIVVSLEKKNEKILLSVKDTGVGITEEDKKNLFKEGGRGKDSIKVNVDSTGYGLYTVKLVIEGHKGRVWCESEGAGKGSQFYIELPVTGDK